MKTTVKTDITATVSWDAVLGSLEKYICTVNNGAALDPAGGSVPKGTESINVKSMKGGTEYILTCKTHYQGLDGASAPFTFRTRK